MAGAVIALAGASVASVQTDSAGRYELLDLTAGEYTLSVRKDAYQVFSQAIRLTQATHANIPLTPLAASAKTDWKLYGNVVDGDSFERISGVTVVVEEMVPGMGAVARYSAVSAADGGFDFSGLGSSSARLMIQAEGYDSVIAAVERDGRSAVNLGGITLKRSLKVAGPDLLLKAVDRTGVTVDPATYRASGKVSVIARNNSTFAAGAFDVSVFIDRDNDGALAATDTLISAQRLASGLAAGAERQIDFDLSGATFQFRDEPLSVMVDSQQEVPEAIESNNVQVLASSCAAGGNLQDVVFCLDNSGSVLSFIPIEVEGAIKAIENPNIIPQDGSIRLTVTTSDQAYYYSASNPPNFPARILTPESALSLAKSMKTWNYVGGNDSLETGARNMSTYLKTLSPAASSRTIILVGDGYWAGGGSATLSKVAETVANGVTRIDVIGVGNVNMPELLDNAWPKPANTAGGGNVSVARSSGEIAGAMAQSLGNAVRLTDLSVGGLRIEDAGQGRPVSLLARVGNGGRTSLASTLRFYHGARLLGEVPVPTLATGTFVDLRLDGVSVSGDGDLRAVVDETKANSECNLSNNVHAIALLAARPVGQIAVSTDRPTYAMGDAVRLHAVSTNKGAVPAEFKMKLSIEDASGAEVLAFAERDLGVVASGAEVTQNEVWASAGFRAGAYALVGTLMASDGSVVAEDRAAFAVSASAGAALRTTTDKATYGAGEWVTLQAAVSNLAVNASLSGARVSLKVIDPKGAVVFTQTRSLGEIGAMATREIVLPKALMAGATGRYVVEAVLSSAQGQTLAQGRTFFDVSADVSTVLAGQVDLSRDILQRGDLQLRGDTIHNRSGLAIGALKIARVILRESDGKEVHRVESSLAFAAGETKRLPPLSIESLNLAQGNYIAVLQVAQTAQIQRSRMRIQAAEPAGWQVLSAASFLVTESAVTPLTPAAPTPVPTLSDFALLMLAALLGVVAWVRRPARG
ncbi:MAG: carboxypeptidase regulatory-like domain-containing protein [Uliginosibacterium sp.]|nr:carboxypeptidase regulatory-like domain-containing protein [Uliginosibacterium sp.]